MRLLTSFSLLAFLELLNRVGHLLQTLCKHELLTVSRLVVRLFNKPIAVLSLALDNKTAMLLVINATRSTEVVIVVGKATGCLRHNHVRRCSIQSFAAPLGAPMFL